MEKIRVLVVEDEARQRNRLVKLLDPMPDYEVAGTCSNGLEAVEAIRAKAPDLVLLDVQMPEMDGLEVLDAVGPERAPAVIFVTAYDQYALRAFELHALDYLLKPFDDERFERVLERARSRIRQGQVEQLGRRLLDLLEDLRGRTEPAAEAVPAPDEPNDAADYVDRLAIKTGGRLLLVKVRDIRWIAGAGVYAELHVDEKNYYLRETLTNLEQRLPPDKFLRIHRSTIVNIDYVKELIPHLHGEYVVVLDDGTRLKLSRSYRDRLDEALGSLG